MGRIDWDNPPSQRRVHDYLPQHLIFDVVVVVASLFVLRLLWRAMHGAGDVSARGVRDYFVSAQQGSPFLVWGVLFVCALAALFAIIDAALALLRHQNNAARKIAVSKNRHPKSKGSNG